MQETGGMIYWPAKAPGEVEDFAFDFTDALQAGETIVSRTVAATGVTVDSDPLASPKVTVWLSGGTLGVPGIVTCSVTTNSTPPRTYSETAILPIGVEPVSLAMARRQLRNEGVTADDDYVLELIQAAREYAEVYCGIRLAPVALQMTFENFVELERLSAAPVQSVTEITYLDAAGAEQVLDPGVYELLDVDADPLRPRIRRKFNQSWPAIRTAEDAVRVSAVAGYTVVPKAIIRGNLLLISHWYDNRNPVAVDVRGVPTELAHAVHSLFANYRR